MSERLTDEELSRLADQFAKPALTDGKITYEQCINLLVAEVRAARELLAEIEWAGVAYAGDREDGCPRCQGNVPNHRPGCKLAAALGR